MEVLSVYCDGSQNTTFWTIQNIKDAAYILVAVVTITIAILGFHKWKKELRGKAYFDFSHRFLKQAYIIRDTLHDARGILFTVPESRDAGAPSHDEQERELENIVSVYSNRHKNVFEAAQEFNSLITEGEALHGKSFRKTAQQLTSKLNVYSYSIDQHLQHKKNFIYDSQRAPMPDVWKTDVDPIVHRQGGIGKDQFGDSIEKIVEDLNKVLVPYIRKYKP